MSKYSDLNQFLNGLDDLSTADLNAKITLMVNADSSRVEMACDKLNGHTEDSLKSKLMCMLYADHVTTELQAENAALRAKVAELEKGRDWQPIESAPRDGSWILITDTEYESYVACWSATIGNGYWFINAFQNVHIPKPTHWQPLPPKGGQS